jgi:hypothetical protein
MDNFQRGDRAEALVKIYLGDDKIEDTGDRPLWYLVADLGHMASRRGFDFNNIIIQGVTHYGADCVEQAQANSQQGDTGNPIDHALTILRANHVPPIYDQEILAKLGLIDYEQKVPFEKLLTTHILSHFRGAMRVAIGNRTPQQYDKADALAAGLARAVRAAMQDIGLTEIGAIIKQEDT